MTYDPRRGESPYLGMEVDGGDTGGAEASPRPREASRATRRPAASAPASVTPQSLTADVPPTTLRDAQAPRRGVAPRTGAPVTSQRPLRRQQSQAPRAVPRQSQAPRAVPSPSQQRFEPEPSQVPSMVRRRLDGPLTMLKVVLLVLLAWVLRLAAIALSVLVVLSAVLTGAHRVQLVSSLNLAPLLVPPALLGHFVRETPFGGILRGDMAIASIILFCADWLCIRLSTSLRERRERGA